MAPLRKEKARKVKILIMGEGGSISWKESVRERDLKCVKACAAKCVAVRGRAIERERARKREREREIAS